jgi:hypothetical protein
METIGIDYNIFIFFWEYVIMYLIFIEGRKSLQANDINQDRPRMPNTSQHHLLVDYNIFIISLILRYDTDQRDPKGGLAQSFTAIKRTAR